MGGAEYQVSLIIKALIERGNFEIHYLCRNANFATLTKGYSLHSIASNSPLSAYAKFTDAMSLFRKLEELKPDIIYNRNGGALTGVCAHYAKKYEKPFFWHLAHEKEVIPKKERFFKNPMRYVDTVFFEYGINNAKVVIAQYNHQSELLNRHYQKSADILIANFQPIPPHIEKKYSQTVKILWVANFNYYKQPHLCLELAKRLESRPNILLTMVGRAPADYSILVEEINKQNNIDYRGSMPINEVNELFQAADIFINTSSKEGFPNSFIQAWMREVPVVSLSVNPDGVLTRESIGFCSSTINQMELDVLKLIEDKYARLAMGKRAREYAIKNHSTANIKILVDLFESAVNN
jgi:glycosyltransferase involved in cell wall biosynthesis